MSMRRKKLIKQIKSLLVSVCLGLTLLPQVALADSFAPPSDLPGLPPFKTLKNWFVAHDKTMIVEFPNGVLFKFEILDWADMKDCAVVQSTSTGELRWLIDFRVQRYGGGYHLKHTRTKTVEFRYKR